MIGVKVFQPSDYALTLHRSPEILVTRTEQEDTASRCARGGSDWTSGGISSLQRLSSCPGGVWVPIPEVFKDTASTASVEGDTVGVCP